jgi:branched-chain amino acid transport system substrate-binding protein
MTTRLAAMTFLGAASLAAACSATRFDHQACREDSQCRAAFGFGMACNLSEGLCAPVKPAARCTTTFPEDLFSRPEHYRDAVVIGSLMDRSSDAHVVREKAVRLAVKEASEAGGLEGRPLAAVMCDIAPKAEYDALTRTAAAVESARFLAGTLGVAAIVGPSASADAEQVWQAVRTPGTVVISPAATSPALVALEPQSTDEQPGYLWRLAPPDSLQGTVIAEDMLARGVKEAAVIRETGPYGEGLAQVFQTRFTQGGGTAVITSISAETQIGEASAMVAAARASEVLFISSQQDWVVKFLNAGSGQQAYQSKGIFLTDAAANQGVLTGASAAAPLFPRVRGTRPAPRDPKDYVFASFVADYKAQYRGEDPAAATFSGHSYDAAWMALYASAWSLLREGSVNGLGVSRGLKHMSAGAATAVIPSSWTGVVNAFRAGNGVNVSGASGELDFDATTRNVVGPIEIWTIATSGGPPAITHLDTRTPKN